MNAKSAFVVPRLILTGKNHFKEADRIDGRFKPDRMDGRFEPDRIDGRFEPDRIDGRFKPD